MNVALYARVSTQHQAQTQTIQQQIELLTLHAQTNGWVVTQDTIFRDDGYSGSSLKRPGLDALRDRAAIAQLERILICAPDRLARKYVHQVLLIEELERFGCTVEFLERPMSQDPHDQLLLQIRGAVAEYERSLIAERMRRGRLRKMQAGLLLPWTTPPFGYGLDPDAPRNPAGVRLDEAQAAVVKEIFSLYIEEGATLWSIARHLHAQRIPTAHSKRQWALSTLRTILTNPVYTGRVYSGRQVWGVGRRRHSATHQVARSPRSRLSVARDNWTQVATVPAIISDEHFEMVQAKLARNKETAQRNNHAHQYLLRALVSCGICQLACIGRHLPTGYGYYMCSGKSHLLQTGREEKCRSRYTPAPQLDDVVWQDLCEVMKHPASIAYALERAHGGHLLPQELQARRQNLRRGQMSIDQQIERLTEAYLSAVLWLEEYDRRRRDLEQKRQALVQQEKQLEAEGTRHSELQATVTTIEEFCQRVSQGLEQASFEQKRQLVELLVDRVLVSNGEIEIRYVIPTSAASENVRFCHLCTDYSNCASAPMT
jgi:site-specific DNA recombinase